MAHRTPIQIALLIVGLVAWGFGMRGNDGRLTWIGLGLFAAAFLLRFWKKNDNVSS
ncbi:MAG TPA: hypothetical protein VN706_19685 [Gemmatimonadaceae bacterium]|nr:hypothetical protein [Gemmatimonadaceae bacterium]